MSEEQESKDVEYTIEPWENKLFRYMLWMFLAGLLIVLPSIEFLKQWGVMTKGIRIAIYILAPVIWIILGLKVTLEN